MRILVTGGYGFIGSCLIKKLLKDKKNIVLNIDSKSYSSMPESLAEHKNNNQYLYKNIDIANYQKLNNILLKFKPNTIFHLAAESHVDNSIKSPDVFIKTNILGTYNLLDISKNYWIKYKILNFKFIHISTDEVYGSINKLSKKIFSEKSKFLPNSPYAASKASSDLIVRSWYKTYKLPTIITNCSNNFGPWQYPEKFIPVIIRNCLNYSNIPIYGNGENIREWIYVEDHVNYLINLSNKGIVGETYNIGSGEEFSNIQIVKKICLYFDKKFKKNKSHLTLISFVKDRAGHDFKYSINSDKINKLLPSVKKNNSFDKNFFNTIDWYIKNKKWLNNKIIK